MSACGAKLPVASAIAMTAFGEMDGIVGKTAMRRWRKAAIRTFNPSTQRTGACFSIERAYRISGKHMTKKVSAASL